MKKLYVLTILVAAAAQAQIVNIPDANFKARLLAATALNNYAQDAGGTAVAIDTNGDNEIQQSEAAALYGLNLENAGIGDFQGLEAFTGLHVLRIGLNTATSIDLSALTALEDFNASPSNLSGLDVSMLPNLKTLAVYGPIGSIDVSNNPLLNYLYVAGCGLTALDVSGNTALTYLDCDTNSLTSLNLSNNTGLQELHCVSNLLTSLDVTLLPQLDELQCATNPLTSIDVSQNPLLTVLDIAQCQIPSVDVSQNALLAVFFCGNNPMPAVDVSQNPVLQIFHCEGNGLASVDISQNPQLYNLDVSGNELTVLDIHNNPGLAYIDCSLNQLTELNLSNAAQLNALYCAGNLFTTLDISQNPLLCFFTPSSMTTLQTLFLKNGSQGCYMEFQIQNDPNLSYVCTDSDEVAYFTQYLAGEGTNLAVNSYCSFTPGGPYNTITGTALFDAAGDGCGPEDLPQPFVKIHIDDSVNQGDAFTINDGHYTFYTGQGNFTVSPDIENPSFFNLSPASATISFPVPSGQTQIQDFCISGNGTHHDTEVVFAPETAALPGFQARYRLVFRNKGNQQESGTVSLVYDATRMQLQGSTIAPTTSAGGVLTFDYDALLPFANRSVVLNFNINSPTDVPPVNGGDMLDFSASITGAGTDDVPLDNTFDLHQDVVNSLDPNDITCLEGDILPTTDIGEYLHYIINFENTGTFEAQNVVVQCQADPAQYDISTLRVLETSADCDVRVNGDIIEYIFKNIHLEIGGHGNILLKIRSDHGLTEGAVVAQKADIFFDYNLPVTTNDAETTFQTLSVGDHPRDVSIGVYPNPSAGMFHVSASGDVKTLQVYDVQGRLLQVSHPQRPLYDLDLSARQAGVYFLKVETDKGASVLKLIRE